MEIDTVDFAVNKCLGIDKQGNVHNGGLIQRLNLSSAKVDYLKKYCSTEMNRGASWVDMWRNVDMKFLEIEENETFEPINIFCRDINSVEHRLRQLADAQRLELTHFFYSGGLHLDSRDFCIHNNGRIFNMAEIGDWTLQPFAKDIPFYNPILDFGGRGCHHYPDFISGFIAKAMKEEKDKEAEEQKKQHLKNRNNA